MRGAAAHLWWSYYRALKKRDGVIGREPDAKDVSNTKMIAKRSSPRTKIALSQPPRSRR